MSDDDLRQRIAERHGIADQAHRLKGSTEAQLEDDAEAIAALRGVKPPSSGDPIRDALMRLDAKNARGAAALGLFGPSVEPSTDEPRTTSFDGGVREPGPPSPPSVDSLIRGEREIHRSDVNDRARNLDASRD